MDVTIYGLRCPINGEIKYVGKAVDATKRCAQHTSSKELKKETHKTHWLRKLLKNGLYPEVVVLETVENDKWQEREIWWIAHLRSQGAKLTNIRKGGNGFQFGDTHSEETRKKISKAGKGRVTSEETRMKISASFTAEKRAECGTRMKEMLAKFDGNRRAALKTGKIKHAKAASQFRGVTYNTRPGRVKRWVARLNTPEGKTIQLGYFLHEQDAALAYNAAAIKYIGADAVLN